MLTKLATFSPFAPDGDPLVRVFHKGDSIQKVAGHMLPEIRDWLSCYTPPKNKLAVLIHALGATEYYGQNSNGDAFYEDALIHDCRGHKEHAHPIDDFTGKIIPPYGYWTFEFAHAFQHHRNNDPTRAFGNVQLACWHPSMKRVELVVEIDRDLAMAHGAQGVVDRIDAGEPSATSMGCRVPYDVCLICEHKARTKDEYCTCVKQIGMGKILDDGRQIGVANPHPRFFDISFVFVGADKTSWATAKLASAGNIPQSVLDAELLYGPPIAQEGLVKAASYEMPTESRTYEVAGHPDTVKTVDKFLQVVQHLGSIGASRSLEVSVDGDGPERLSVKGTKTPLDRNSLESAVDQDTVPLRAIKSAASVSEFSGESIEEGTGLPLRHQLVFGETRDGSGRVIVTRKAPPPEETTTLLLGKPDYQEDYPGDEDSILRLTHPDDYRNKQSSVDLTDLIERAKYVKVGPPPTPNRKEFPFVGALNFRGLEVHVEQKQGDVREGTSSSGKKWRTVMNFPYGEFKGSRGTDGDKLDVYVGPYRNAPNVYIVHQNHPRGHGKAGHYDEDKVMLGFRSPEEAKAAYLSQYSNDSFFRSITTMSFNLFKRALERKEVHGQKVAGYRQLMTKVAEELALEDLFAQPSLQRQRVWRSLGGKEVRATGSGLSKLSSARITAQELLKLSDDKLADLRKWADIVKEIGPSKAVGQVSPALSDAEPDLPKELLNVMGKMPTAGALATPSLLGMVLKPREFQRVMLTGCGEQELADDLDARNAQFEPDPLTEHCPCQSLQSSDLLPKLLSVLLPFIGDRSYATPVVRRRIINITLSPTAAKNPSSFEKSPLLSKVAAAYNWYRREQLKLAADMPRVIAADPQIYSRMFGMDLEGMFAKEAMTRGQLYGTLGAIPLTLMYSAHQKEKRMHGVPLGVIDSFAADHPWVSSLGAVTGMKHLLTSPSTAVMRKDLGDFGRKLWHGVGPQA
jgi:hypothetical protein